MRHQPDQQIVMRRRRPGSVRPALLHFSQLPDMARPGADERIVSATVEHHQNKVVPGRLFRDNSHSVLALHGVDTTDGAAEWITCQALRLRRMIALQPRPRDIRVTRTQTAAATASGDDSQQPAMAERPYFSDQHRPVRQKHNIREQKRCGRMTKRRRYAEPTANAGTIRKARLI